MHFLHYSSKKFPIENNRGPLVSLVQICINLGFIASIWATLFLPGSFSPSSRDKNYWLPLEGINLHWRLLFGLPIIISVIQILFFLFIFRKENPIYLKHHSSSGSIEEWSNSEEESSRGDMNIDIQQSFQKPLTTIDKDTWKNLWSLEGKRRLAAGCIVRIFLQLTGINFVINYADMF